MLLRLPVRCLLFVVWTYSALFVSLGASDFRYLRFVGSGGGSGDDSCVACPMGTYADNNTLNCNCSCNCTSLTSPAPPEPCDCSGYCDTNSSCKDCDYGFHANKTASTQCSECDYGHFANSTGAINCTACRSGTFINITGAKECINCPLGTYTNKTGMHTCETCLHGHYCNETEKTGTGCNWCRPCPAGSWSRDALNCSLCPYGTFNPQPGSGTCQTCDQDNGKVCMKMGCKECAVCEPGHQPNSPYSCVPCTAGMYSNPKTRSLCRRCEDGYYQPDQGQSSCKECPEGSYCPYPSSEPMVCPSDAHCPNGSIRPVFCSNTLMQYDSASRGCAPKPVLYGIVICILIVIVLVAVLIGTVIYCTYFRPKKIPEEKIHLVKKAPVQNPTYDGY